MWGCHFWEASHSPPIPHPLLESRAGENARDQTPIPPGQDDLIDIFQPPCLLPPNKMTCASKQLLPG